MAVGLAKVSLCPSFKFQVIHGQAVEAPSFRGLLWLHTTLIPSPCVARGKAIPLRKSRNVQAICTDEWLSLRFRVDTLQVRPRQRIGLLIPIGVVLLV